MYYLLSKQVMFGGTILTHLSRMNFPISIGMTSLVHLLGVSGGIFFIQILIEHAVSKQCSS